MVSVSPIFAVLTDKLDTPRDRLYKLASLPLAERSPAVVYLEEVEPHIWVLWVFQFVTPSYVSATPKDRKVLAFSGDLQCGQLPTTVNILPEWLKQKDIIAPTVAVIEWYLDAPPPWGPQV